YRGQQGGPSGNRHDQGDCPQPGPERDRPRHSGPRRRRRQPRHLPGSCLGQGAYPASGGRPGGGASRHHRQAGYASVSVQAVRGHTMSNPLFDLTGKVALVTGSTKGIGRSIVEELARCGAKVVVSSRKADACEQVAAELKAQGFEAIAVPCHVGKKDDLQNLVNKTLETWGRIDVLVCNAATNPVYGPTSEMTDEAWDKIMETNVKGTFWLTNMVLPQMAELGGGSVILLSSIAG